MCRLPACGLCRELGGLAGLLAVVLTMCSCPVLTDSPNVPYPGSHGTPPGTMFVPALETAGGPEGNRRSAIPHCHEMSLRRQEGPLGEALLASWERRTSRASWCLSVEWNWASLRPGPFFISSSLLLLLQTPWDLGFLSYFLQSSDEEPYESYAYEY